MYPRKSPRNRTVKVIDVGSKVRKGSGVSQRAVALMYRGLVEGRKEQWVRNGLKEKQRKK